LLSADGWLARVVGLAARELTLSPGDAVEIGGVVDLEPDPDAQRGFERSPALRPVLRPAAGLPVIVRKREDDDDPAEDDDAPDGDGAGRASPIDAGTVTSAVE
jgi:hypothetical protein